MAAQHRSESVVAVVVAAGSGVRLGGDRPKALRTVGGIPLVVHAVNTLIAAGCTEVVVVVAADQVQTMTDLCADLGVDDGVDVCVCIGGERRQDSVAAGLASIQARSGIVLVHDAARPLVPLKVVADVVAAVAAGAAAVVPAIPLVDTIRQVNSDGASQVVDRASLRAVQTPQGFDLPTLRAAHERVGRAEGAAAGASARELTDDASVCEAAGYEVSLVDGSPQSLKITTPDDLVLAEAIWEASR